MKLTYHKAQNFGDALNPMIWEHFLPGCFDEDESELFIGIGTLLGFDYPTKAKKIVFSTGAALDNNRYYGKVPQLDETWKIMCVRGPLTAELLKINKKFAITDGAVLIKKMFDKPNERRHYNSFMPHHKSLEFFNYEGFCDKYNIHFIDPRKNVHEIIQDIQQSKFLITEAMHGAIVADALRIPWVPVKIHGQVNKFKWFDWAESMNINQFSFQHFKPLYDKSFLIKISKNKIPFKYSGVHNAIASTYKLYQDIAFEEKLNKRLHALFKKDGFLSNPKILDERLEQMQNQVESFKKLIKK